MWFKLSKLIKFMGVFVGVKIKANSFFYYQKVNITYHRIRNMFNLQELWAVFRSF